MGEVAATVLVVESPQRSDLAIAPLLAQEGLGAEACGPHEAVVRARSPQVVALLLDLRAAGAQLERLRELRAACPELPLLLLATPDEQDAVLEALRLGAADYLARPLHAEDLRLAVRRAVAGGEALRGRRRLRRRIEGLERALFEIERAAPSGAAALRRAAPAAVARALEAEKATLLWVDEDGKELRVEALHGRPLRPETMDSVRVGQGIAGRVFAADEPLLVVDLGRDPRFPARIPPDRYRTASLVAAPLRVDGPPVGVLCATDPVDAPAFDPGDLTALRLLASVLGRALARPAAPTAPSPPAAPTAPSPAASLAQTVCEALVANADAERALLEALARVGTALGAAPVSLQRLSEDGEHLEREAQWDGGRREDRARLPRRRGLTGVVAESGVLVACADPQRDPRFDPEVDTPATGVPGPFLCGPLRLRGRPLGLFRAFPARAEDATPEAGEQLAAALSAAYRQTLLYRSLIDSTDEVARARREARGPAGAEQEEAWSRR